MGPIPSLVFEYQAYVLTISVIYRGPYHGVEVAYNRIFSFEEENNLETILPRELYFNDPAEVPEEELMTEVQIQVQEK